MSSSERFGFEWNKYNSLDAEYYEQYKNQFLNWVAPLTPEYFKNKSILDAGCGMGRNSYWCLQWGCAALTAFDKDSRSVRAAKNNLAEFNNCEVKEADIYNLPWENKFDFAMSIGVIHHLAKPKRALAEIKKTLKPQGEILIWVYGIEGFGSFVKILNPIRKHITSKLPLPLLHGLTYLASIPLYFYLKIFKPKKEYLKQISRFSFRHLHSIIFDQLLPAIANYYSKEQAMDLLSEFKDVAICQPPNKNGWIVRGKKN